MTSAQRSEEQERAHASLAASVCGMLDEIAPIGATEHGFRRSAWSEEDRALRAWFVRRAEALGLSTRLDSAGNQWAWWEGTTPTAVTTGSHLDSVPGGGAFDGPLGVICAFAAVEQLRSRGLSPEKPIGIANMADEEGARFGVACFGSRVLTGALPPDTALALTGADSRSLAELLPEHGVPVAGYGPDPALLSRIDAHIELHIEQGYALAGLDAPVGVASHIWPHGRWLARFVGEANHAGTTPMDRRDDPTIAMSRFVLAVREAAIAAGAVATVGRIELVPGGANVIAGSAIATLDVRAPDEPRVRAVLDALREYPLDPVSWTDATDFDATLRDGLVATLARDVGIIAPVLGTGAGHDAGILQAAGVPSAMLFVRNTTGASHTPAEHATIADCATGAAALAACLVDLAHCRQTGRGR